MREKSATGKREGNPYTLSPSPQPPPPPFPFLPIPTTFDPCYAGYKQPIFLARLYMLARGWHVLRQTD